MTSPYCFYNISVNFSLNNEKVDIVKVEMIKGIYDYSKKGKDFLKGTIIGSSKHFVMIY